MTPEEVTPIVREHVAPDLDVVSLSRASVGNSQETWIVVARDPSGAERDLILRRSSGAGVLAWTERDAEYRVLKALEGRGLPVPVVYATGTLEREYLLMERRPGAVMGRATEDEKRSIARELGQWLARLHALDPARDLGLEVPLTAREATLGEVAAYRARYLAERPGPVPLLGGLLAWCERNAPDDGAAPRLLWGDAGSHNALVVGGTVTALLDWEISHVGHPMEDLGGAVWGCLGVLDPELLITAYEKDAGPVDRSTLAYYVTLANVTRGVMVVNGVAAWLDGRVTQPSTAGLGLDLLALCLARGADAAGWGDVPRSDGRPPSYPLRPSAAEIAAGMARWLLADVMPAVEEQKRLRRMAKAGAKLLESAALRVPADAAAADADAMEERVIAAELAGGDSTLREELVLDLSRELVRLEPLTMLHGHPLLGRG
jgi:aminoglycoside phosphotransferase (APT) family kinase protein